MLKSYLGYNGTGQIGSVPHQIKYGYDDFKKKLDKAGAVMALMPKYATGVKAIPLEPRTLPNGVCNGLYKQKVSADYVLKASDIDSTLDWAGITYARINQSVFVGLFGSGTADADAKKLFSSISEPRASRPITSSSLYWHDFISTTSFGITLPLGTTITEARTLLAGTVIRYQLATPIDTLNTPLVNPLVDYAGRVGKNLFDWTNAINGYYFDGSGNVVARASTFYSPVYLPVSEGQKIKPNHISGSVQAIAYDLNKNFISRTNIIGVAFTVPANVAFLRFSFYEIDKTKFTAQIEYGEVTTTYEPYGYNNALLQGFGFTGGTGYELVPFVNSNGVDVGYANLVSNANLVDSNADGLADGFTQANTTNRTCVGGIQKFTATVQFGQIETSDIPVENGKKYLVIFGVKTGVVGAAAQIVRLNNSTNLSAASGFKASNTGINVLEDLYGIYTPNASGNIRVRVVEARASAFTEIEYTKPIVINLTDMVEVQALESQIGRSYTALECDRLFPFIATTGVSKIANRVVLQSDGLDDRGVLSRNYGNIGSGDDFALCWGGLMPSALNTGFIFASNLSDATTLVLASLINANGSLGTYVANSLVNTSAVATLVPNEVYDYRLIRTSGSLKLEVYDSKGTKATIFTLANTSVITWQSFMRLFCRSNSVDGLTNSAFAKLGLTWCTLHIGTYGDLSKLDATIDKIAKDYRLGV